MRNARVATILWLLGVIGFILHSIDPPLPFLDLLIATLAFGFLMALYLVHSHPSMIDGLKRIHERGHDFGFSGILWFVFLILTLIVAPPDAIFSLALGGTILWIPIVLIRRNKDALTPPDALLGLVALLLPLSIDALLRTRTLDAIDLLLRVGAFALPVLLILFTTREQKQRLNFPFIAAVLFLWYTIEFGNLPALGLPQQDPVIRYIQFAIIVLFLHLLGLTGRLADLRFTFSLTRRDLLEVLINFALFSIIALPFGLLTNFIRPSTSYPLWFNIIGDALAIFVFIALPEEILFRGAIHRYLEHVLRWGPRLTLLLSSIIFGAAHLDNPPNVGLYFILATIAGIFYGRTYLRTGKIVPAALVHMLVDWTWAIFFAG